MGILNENISKIQIMRISKIHVICIWFVDGNFFKRHLWSVVVGELLNVTTVSYHIYFYEFPTNKGKQNKIGKHRDIGLG